MKNFYIDILLCAAIDILIGMRAEAGGVCNFLYAQERKIRGDPVEERLSRKQILVWN